MNFSQSEGSPPLERQGKRGDQGIIIGEQKFRCGFIL